VLDRTQFLGYILSMLMRLLIGLLGIVLAVMGFAAVARAGSSPDEDGALALQRYSTPEGLAELIHAGEQPYLLVDVRTTGEYAAGHIPTAINIPYDRIAAGLQDQPTDRVLVLYCRTGRRSGVALSELRRHGFSDIVDFGGISRWNGPIVRP